MKKKMASRMISLLLIAAMLFTMTGVSAFAEGEEEEKETKNVLVFGASTSNGYALPDFLNENAGYAFENNDLENWKKSDAEAFNWEHRNEVYERSRISEFSYPWILKQYIAETEFDNDLGKVRMNPITLHGLRTNELRAMLDEDYYEAVYEWEKKTTVPDYNRAEDGSPVNDDDDIGFLSNHVKTFVKSFYDAQVIEGVDRSTVRPGGEAYEAAKAYLEDEIAKSDVIIVDVSMNNFGTYLAERVAGKHDVPGKDYAKYYWKQNKEDIPGVSAKTLETADKLKKAITMAMPVVGSGSAEEFLDSFIYCFIDWMTNYSAAVDLVRNLNKNAKIITVGVYNTLDGINLVLGDQTLDFGSITAKGFDLVNAYAKGLDKNSNNYYFADVSGGIETYMNQIRNAESFEALMDTTEDDSGKFLMDNMYEDFMNSYDLNGLFADDPADNYAGIKNGVETNFQNAIALPEWTDESVGPDDPIVGKTYVTLDQSNLDPTAADFGLPGALGVDPTGTSPNLLTKNVVRELAAMMLQMQGIEQPTAEQIEAVAVENYPMIKNGIEAQFQNMISVDSWDDQSLGDDDPITGKTYVVCTGDKSAPYSVNPKADQEGVVYLTKSIVPSKENVQKLLYDAGRITDIHLDELMENLGSEEGMGSIVTDIEKYLLQGIRPKNSTMELLHVVDRFILYMGVGQHPSKKGCLAMADDVITAYDKAMNGGNTAFEDQKEQIQAMLNDLLEMLRGTGAKDDIDAIIEKIDKIQAAMDMLDEAQASMDQLRELMALKEKLAEYVGEALDLLGITVDDLIAQGQFIADSVDPVWVAEQIKLLNDIIMNWPELKEEYQAKIEEYYEKMMDQIDKVIDELIKQKELFENSEELKKIIETIEILREAVKNMPKSEEEFKELALEQLDKTLDLLEAKAAEYSEDLAAQIKEIREMIEKAVTEGDYQDLIDKLLPIGEKLLAIGDAVADLPEYREAMDEYIETSNELMAGLEERVSALEKQAGKLIAKSIKVEFTPKLTFPKKKAKVTLAWEYDDDASGYDVAINGKEVEPYETKTGMAYDQTSVVIGKTYKYEITPYIYYDIDGKTELIKGRTFKKTFVPKVKVKKAALKKVKAAKSAFKATWKKVKGANGYKLSYKVGKKTKYKTVKSAKKVSLTVKKLKAGKTYTVKVRAYKTVNGKKYFGKWSKAKKVKVK